MSRTTLVRARWIVTGAGPDDPVLDDAALQIEDGQIVARGAWKDLRARHPDATVVGGPGMAAIPGLINAHHHAVGPTQQQYGLMDDFLEPWIFGFACFRGRDVSLGTLLSCARQLRSGVTSVVDVHSGAGKAKDYAGRVDAALNSYAQSGMRVGFAPGLSTRCRQRSPTHCGPGGPNQTSTVGWSRCLPMAASTMANQSSSFIAPGPGI